jgi:hypothetical protein
MMRDEPLGPPAMKKLLILTILGALLPATAYADSLCHRSEMRYGTSTSTRGASGRCGFSSAESGRTLVLHCSSGSGRATASYRFATSGRKGTASAHVEYERRSRNRPTVRTAVRYPSANVAEVQIQVSGDGARIDLRSVSLSFYADN